MSSLLMVSVAVLRPTTLPGGLARTSSTTVSSASASVSLKIETVKLAVVAPPAKVTSLFVNAVKSRAFAVPPTVETMAVMPAARPPVRRSVIVAIPRFSSTVYVG